jgi:hypothetical protein
MLRSCPLPFSPENKALTLILLSLIALALPNASRAQNPAIELDKVYADESHCLLALEIRNDDDKPNSRYCRDALVDFRYVYETYLSKDRNMYGVANSLALYATSVCGNYNVWKASEPDWKWNGPEVTRVYPPDRIIEQIKPNEKGWRSVLYQVNLTFRDVKGRVTKTEQLSAEDRFPPEYPCSPWAECSKNK